jgi:CHAD domain-containing protein
MAYAFEKGETVSEGVQRIALEQLDLAVESLVRPGDDLDAAIHRARQSLKRLRALLALVRAELGEEVYRHENGCFRDAARLLARTREAAVLGQTLDETVELFPEELASIDVAALREVLARTLGTGDEAAASASLRSRAIDLLAVARTRVATWPIRDDGFSALGPGLEAICRSGRRMLADVAADPRPEAFHEWRKPVKQHLHHIQLLAPVWPRVLDALAGELQALSDALNDSHDLANLRTALLEARDLVVADERDALLAAIGARRLELDARALSLGARLYAERPRELRRRLKRYWLAWRRSDANAVRGARTGPFQPSCAPSPYRDGTADLMCTARPSSRRALIDRGLFRDLHARVASGPQNDSCLLRGRRQVWRKEKGDDRHVHVGVASIRTASNERPRGDRLRVRVVPSCQNLAAANRARRTAARDRRGLARQDGRRIEGVGQMGRDSSQRSAQADDRREPDAAPARGDQTRRVSRAHAPWKLTHPRRESPHARQPIRQASEPASRKAPRRASLARSGWRARALLYKECRR